MPARRELHTGRYNFLHRGWSPLEPFDDSVPELLKKKGIYTHLISDHYHYWEDGGSTYHSRFQSWECIRGQEGDPWIGDIGLKDEGTYIEKSSSYGPLANQRRQDQANRKYIREHNEYPQQMTFARGLEFIETNKNQDNWFLQMETFDPHEPFFVPQRFIQIYEEQSQYTYDWPPYGVCRESRESVDSGRAKDGALLSMCDECLGQVLDLMDANDMWKDTMLIVNTDHGYFLGEKDWWSKGAMPTYNEIAHTPLFIWDPSSGVQGQRRQALTQTIDLAPTLLDYFGLPIPEDMQGRSLRETIASDKKIRDYALFGFYGSHVNITDGQYVYMRGPANLENAPLNNYTLMPLDMHERMPVKSLQKAALHEPFAFTKGCPVLQIETNDFWNNISPHYHFGHMLFDLAKDPRQLTPIRDEARELDLMAAMIELMRQNDAPEEQYERLGLPADGNGLSAVLDRDKSYEAMVLNVPAGDYKWTKALKWQYWTLCKIAGGYTSKENIEKLFYEKVQSSEVTSELLLEILKVSVPEDKYRMAAYTMDTMSHIQ